MNELKIEKLNELIYETKLNNGFKILLYPTKKSKNFYITLTTRLGANILKFKRDNKITNIIPGTAHFLEHKVMNLEDEGKQKKLETLGSSPNAYTTYIGTTYEIYGSKNIFKNIEILFNTVFCYKSNKESIEKEKPIIAEEIDMNKDDVYSELNEIINDNLFIKSPYKNTILGEKEDINQIEEDYLDYVYESFYNPSNMFTIVTGNFNVEEVEKYISDYVNKLNAKTIDTKIINIKEPFEIKNNYVEKTSNVVIDKVCFSYKLPLKDYKMFLEDEVKLSYYIMLDCLFGSTSSFKVKAKENGLIQGNISYMSRIQGKYIITKIITNTDKVDECIKKTEKLLKNIKIDKESFERKKKNILSSYILAYEDIEQVANDLINEELVNKKIDNETYSKINNLTYETFLKIISNFKNHKKVIGRIYK